MRQESNLAGKEIIIYTNKSRKKYTSNDISQFLRKFKLFKALAFIGEISYQLLKNNQHKIVIQEVPIFNSILAYIAMRLIENSNDYRSKDMSIDELLKSIDMYFGIPDPAVIDNQNIEGCLIRFGSSQFDYEREARHLLPRTLIMYRDLWTTALNANKVDINDALQNICGLSLKEILIFGFVFSLKSDKGFFRIYDEGEKCPNNLTDIFTLEKQAKFVKWISCRYSNFRASLQLDIPPTPDYEKFRFNPLLKTPVIIPDRNPSPGYSQVYIAPIPRLIYERVTRGLYFDFADYFKGNKASNPFRSCFGNVFQEYVGLIFKKSLGENNVKAEWKYGSKKQQKDTPDWLIIQDKRAILVEVKQSGLYLTAKKWGELQNIQEDLSRTIGAGVQQMWEFENDIKSGNFNELEWLKDIEITERMIVTYDHPYFLNFILREQIKTIVPNIAENYHWHTITIEELEYFIGIVGNGLFDALRNKRIEADKDIMDFRDYYSRVYSNSECSNQYLDSVFNDFFADLDI